MSRSAADMKVFPGFDRVYRFSADSSPSAFTAQIDLSLAEGGAALAGELDIDRPVDVTWFMGRREPTDVILTSIVLPLIVSARIIRLLEAHACTGWDTYPVRVLGKNGAEISGYNGLIVRGRCGPLQRERSLPLLKKYPGGMFPAYRGYFFDEHSWDGSDVFKEEGPSALVFVLEKVRNAFVNAKVTGVSLERADLVERSWL